MKKVCKICGQTVEIKTNSNVCDECKIGTCIQCGNTFRLSSPFTSKFCSVRCKSEYFKKTGLAQIYGQKAKETKIKEYGTTSVCGSTKTRKCRLCGDEFVPKFSNQQYCEKNHYSSCPVCGKQILIDTRNIDTAKCCSDECAAKKRKQTNLERYGSEYLTGSQYFKDKSTETLQEKYGVVNVMQLDQVKEKTRKTWIAKYGVDHPNKSSEVLKKIKKTNLERYGSEWNIQSEEVQSKMKESFRVKYGVENPMESSEYVETLHQKFVDKYGVENPMQLPRVIEKRKTSSYSKYGTDSPTKTDEVKQRTQETCQERYGVPWACMRKEARRYNAISNVNLEFARKLEDRNISYELEFPIENRSFDFHVIGTDILIELDPTITHNSQFNLFDSKASGIDVNYHFNKSRLAQIHGYRCIHIFDWDSQDKIISSLQPHIHLYARDCQVREVSAKLRDEFLNENHLQGTCKGQDFCCGLFYQGILVELMSFGRPRYNRNYEYELLRLCSDFRYSVVGGASKLLHYFLSNNNPKSIISYSDISKFSGKVYDSLGMKHVKDTSPNKVWSKKDGKITDNFLHQRGYDALFGTGYGKGTSNEELMLNSGWLPVYDCGQSVYEYRSNEIQE